MIAIAAFVGVGAALALTLVRLFIGPTLHDRALAAQGGLIKVAVLCAAIAVMTGSAQGVEVAFALVLAAFVPTAAILKFFRARSFQAVMAPTRDT